MNEKMRAISVDFIFPKYALTTMENIQKEADILGEYNVNII